MSAEPASEPASPLSLVEQPASGSRTCPPSMPLLDLLNDFYFRGRQLADTTKQGMRVTVGMFDKWLEHESTLVDLTETSITKFTAYLRSSGWKRNGAANRRSHLVTLAKLAEELGLLVFRYVPASEPESAGSLKLLVEEEYLKERRVCRMQGNHHRHTVRMFGEFLGRPATVNDLTVPDVNRWLLHLLSTGLSSRTVLLRRGCIVSVAKFAEEKDLLVDAAGALRVLRFDRITKIKRSYLTPTAWTPDEVRTLIAAALQLPGTFRRSELDRGKLWAALIAVAYDTGLRPVDLMRLRRSDIQPDGRVWVVQHKTGKPVPCMVQPETAAMIEATFEDAPERDLIFGPFMQTSSTREKWFAVIAKAAGLEGTMYRLRKTSGTLTEIEHPGWGARHLGIDPPTFEKHYACREMLFQNKPMPPRLFPPSESDEPAVVTPARKPTPAQSASTTAASMDDHLL